MTKKLFLECNIFTAHSQNLLPVLVSTLWQHNIDRAYLRVPEHTMIVFFPSNLYSGIRLFNVSQIATVICRSLHTSFNFPHSNFDSSFSGRHPFFRWSHSGGEDVLDPNLESVHAEGHSGGRRRRRTNSRDSRRNDDEERRKSLRN